MIIKAAGGIIIKDNKVLLTKRKNANRFNNMWTNPGGKIEPDETPENAAIREVMEETGLKTKPIKHIHNYEDSEGDKIIGIYAGFLMELISGTHSIKEPNKVSEIKFFDINNLPENITPYTKKYLDVLFTDLNPP